jgi:hypothetical protein
VVKSAQRLGLIDIEDESDGIHGKTRKRGTRSVLARQYPNGRVSHGGVEEKGDLEEG